MNGAFFDSEYNRLPKKVALEFVSQLAADHKMVIKPSIFSGGGKHVKVLDYRGHSPKDIQRKMKEKFNNFQRDFIIQEYLYQHKTFKQMHEHSLNTLRIMTLRLDDEIHILSHVVRMGNNGSQTDNDVEGCITCGFDEEGRLFNYGTDHWTFEKYEKHPHSQFVFKGKTLPGIQESFELVKKAHEYLWYFDLVSWDIAIDQFGEPNLIEIGIRLQDINYHQRTNGPIFKEFTEEILDRVYNRP